MPGGTAPPSSSPAHASREPGRPAIWWGRQPGWRHRSHTRGRDSLFCQPSLRRRQADATPLCPDAEPRDSPTSAQPCRERAARSRAVPALAFPCFHRLRRARSHLAGEILAVQPCRSANSGKWIHQLERAPDTVTTGKPEHSNDAPCLSGSAASDHCLAWASCPPGQSIPAQDEGRNADGVLGPALPQRTSVDIDELWSVCSKWLSALRTMRALPNPPRRDRGLG